MDKHCYHILANWDWSNSLTLNGFHKLFLPLTTAAHSDKKCRFVHVPRARAALLHQQASCKNELASLVTNSSSSTYSDKAYLRPFDKKELIVESQIEADIQFVHTVPATLGERPFVFHIETLNSLFIPWEVNPWDINEKDFKNIILEYQALFSRKECLFIFSHLASSCEMLKDWFAGTAIEDKIFYWPLGREVVQSNLSEKTQFNKRGKRFLFTGSQHGIGHNWGERGIDLFLEFAQSRLNTHPEDQFTVVGSISDSPENVFSLGSRYLSEAQFSKLLLRHDFFFIPSITGHSISVIDSWAHGCVPIMLDLPHYQEMGANEENAIIIRGPAPQEPSHLALRQPHKRQIANEDFVKSLNKRMDSITEIEYSKLTQAGRQHLQTNHCPQASYQHFEKLITESYSNYQRGTPSSTPKLATPWVPQPVIADDFDRRPVVHATINFGSCTLLTDGKHWCSATNPIDTKDYSPFYSGSTFLSPIKKGHSGFFTSQFQDALDTSMEHTLNSFRGSQPSSQSEVFSEPPPGQ